MTGRQKNSLEKIRQNFFSVVFLYISETNKITRKDFLRYRKREILFPQRRRLRKYYLAMHRHRHLYNLQKDIYFFFQKFCDRGESFKRIFAQIGGLKRSQENNQKVDIQRKTWRIKVMAKNQDNPIALHIFNLDIESYHHA